MNAPPLPAHPSSWTDIFLGVEAAQRSAIKRLALTWLTYGFADVVLLLSTWMGMTPAWASLSQVAYHWTGMACFYTLLRARPQPAQGDASLAFEQLLFGVSAIVLAYAISPVAHGAALQLLCLALVFDMQRLSSRQLAAAAWGAVALLAITLTLSWLIRPEGLDLRREVLSLIMAGVQLPALSMIARDVRAMRKKQLQQRLDLQATLGQLEQLSQRDSLTGLFNRHHMGQLLEQELKRFKRHGRTFSLALLDIDHFKQINDRFGHAAGDATLQTFAELAREVLPPADAMARWGGEEFLVLIPEHGGQEACAIIEALRLRVQSHDWGRIAPGLGVTFSAGVIEHSRADTALHRTIEQADQALYEAKARGRNQVRCQTGHKA